jgi:hypothetical protein
VAAQTAPDDDPVAVGSEPALRETITVITNRVESFHRYANWLGFGAEEGILLERAEKELGTGAAA